MVPTDGNARRSTKGARPGPPGGSPSYPPVDFHGACAVGELRGWPLEWTLVFANAIAAMKCRVLGGRRGIPRLPEVAEFLAAHGRRDLAAAVSPSASEADGGR